MTAVRIDVAFKGDEVTDRRAQGSVAVVIDVLRATTMIASLLHAGAKEVWATKEIDDARRLAGRLEGALLAGERGGLPPEGFDMGNSPREIDPAQVAGRPVVITTTNGTAAIERAATAEALVTAAFVNLSAVARLLVHNRVSHVLIVCAGTEGEFSLDDALCAGALVANLEELAVEDRSGGISHSGESAGPGNGAQLTDSAMAARILFESKEGQLVETLMGCRHGRRLVGLGLGGDIEAAADIDRVGIVPVRVRRNRNFQDRSDGVDARGHLMVAVQPETDLAAAAAGKTVF